MKVSLQDIANQLHISRITVSKVLNGKPGVSLETRKKVIQKLVENGYTVIDSDLVRLISPSEPAEKKCVAVVATAPEFADYWIKIIKSITDTVNRMNYDCIYCFLSKEDTLSSLPKFINSKGVDGIIVINVYDGRVTSTLLNLGIPIVFLDISPELVNSGIPGDLILLEGRQCICEITSRIIEQGRTRIGFIGDTTYSKTILDRWEGYRAAMAAHGLTVDPTFCLTKNPNHYYYRADIENQIDLLHTMPEAFVCANDSIALMLTDILKHKNYRVPEDIAVSGFDNIQESGTGNLPLTTVSVDINILGQRLVQQILMRIQIPQMPYEVIYIKPQIIYRKSTSFENAKK